MTDAIPAQMQAATKILLNKMAELEEETVTCTRCEADVEDGTTMRLGDAIICEICWDDL